MKSAAGSPRLSEHKVLIRKPGGRQVEVWAPVTQGAPNHYWDAEVIQFAIADMVRVDTLRPVADRPPAPISPPPQPPKMALPVRRMDMPVRPPPPPRSTWRGGRG